MFVLTLTDDKLLKFVLILGKSCVVFVWGEKLGWPRTLFIILLTFLSRLNEISGGCEKIAPVSGSFWSILKLLRMIVFTGLL